MAGRAWRRALACALVALALGATAACSDASDEEPTSSTTGPSRGGTLHVLVAGEVLTWDPQLMYSGPESFFAQRTFVRTLTTYGTGDEQRALVGDLATDTGKRSKDGKTWTFTLREGVRWEDGTDVTCEDVRRGIAHTFDRDTHIAGTNYATYLLDLPTNVTAEGLEKPTYAGPGDKEHEGDFRKAVVCKDRKITFHLRAPEPDFPHVVALPEFAPRKEGGDGDEAKASHVVASTGPYRLEGEWTPGEGGTFVRNDEWDADTDPVREARPDRIVVESGLVGTSVVQRLLNDEDDDAYAVSWVQASPTLANQAASSPELRARTTFPWTGEVDYLALNMRSEVFKSSKVREAFALATNRARYVTANGGKGAGEPSWSVLSPAVSDVGVAPEGDPPPGGDPEAARVLLEKVGVKTPVKVRVVYAQSLLAEKAYAALAAGWRQAGFDVELHPVPPEEYYKTIEEPGAVDDYDVFRGVWSPDLPSAGAVLPALFDDRINVDSTSPGQDVGYFASGPVNEAMDKALATSDPAARAKQWEKVDAMIRDRTGYVALSAGKAMFIHGDRVRSYEDHVIGGIVDLATVSVDPD